MRASGRKQLGLAVAAVAALLITGCASGLDRPVHEVKATPSDDGVQRIEVTAHAFYFDPNRIVLKANVPVELHVKNSSPMVPHNFSCVAPQAGIQVDEGLGLFWDGETAHFTPSAAGEYKFFCKVDSHANKGMTGTIVVVP